MVHNIIIYTYIVYRLYKDYIGTHALVVVGSPRSVQTGVYNTHRY